MIKEILEKYKITLGSASPRRKKLLKEIGLKFTIKRSNKEEKYPQDLDRKKIAEFLAKQKAESISKELSGNYLLITADTIVIQDNKILHKPKDKDEAFNTLNNLSAKKHTVITGVCIKSKRKEVVFSSKTEITLNQLSEYEILYYIKKYKPYDKAGSYGIQEWIGYIGIEKINGSYSNVVGLPTAKLYQKLKFFT